MALRLRRRSRALQPLEGSARVDRRTKDLLKRIQPGEIAVIRHENLDRIAADGLVDARVLAVINAAPSTTGRYPNIGPLRVVEAGIPLIDVDRPDLLDEIREGSTLRVSGGEIWCGDERIAEGHALTTVDLEEKLEAARAAIGSELELFAENTLQYIHREARLFFEPLTLPELRTQCQGRHALVVVRGHDYRSDLAALRPYMREYKPVLIGVDGGADALLEFGFTPHIIIGDFDSVSERALHCGAELVHHVHPDGRAPGREELADFGVEYQEFVAEGTSEDVAMLLAFEQHATLIVAVGTHATMVEFLDKGRRGMASTFLTRLRLGPMLVDAKGVNSLYEGRVRRLDILLLVGAALVAMIVVGIVAEPIHVFLRGFWVTLKDIFGKLMINFRFHIVSLIAIFLALALGVAIGAGVIDRGVVDTLNDRLDRVEAKSEQQQLLNDILNAANQRDQEFIETFQPWGLEGRLSGELVAFVAIRGVDEDRVQATITATEQAGASVTGVLWIEGKWGQAGDDARALATSIGEPALRGTKLREAAWDRLAERLAGPPFASSDTVPDLLSTLAVAEFVSYEEIEGGLTMAGFPGRNPLFVLVLGEEAEVPSDTVVMAAATVFSNHGLELVVGDVYVDLELGPARGDVFDTLRDSELARTISTVDDLDLVQGPGTAALTLAGLTCAPPVVGHYGYGGLDTAPLPEFTTTCPGVTAPAAVR